MQPAEHTTVMMLYATTPLPASLEFSQGLITDIDMYHFIENSIRGGIEPIPPHCQCMMQSSKRPSIWMRIICMDGECLNHCPPTGFDSSNRMRLTTMPKMDTYLRRISAIDDYALTPESLEIGREIYSPAQQTVFSTDCTSKETHS